MWARVIEVMLAAWLAVSPFIFNISADATVLRALHFGGALLVALFALLSFHRNLRRFHLLHIAIAAALITSAFVLRSSGSSHPALHNLIVVGLLLLMHAIIPSASHLPPRGWREFEGAGG